MSRRLHRELAGVACQPADRATFGDLLTALHAEAILIRDEDVAACRSIGENGLRLLQESGLATAEKPTRILTHCNAGRLATVRYGTATAPIYVGLEQGLQFEAFCDETRPLLQGARLTAFELSQAGISTWVQCDSMSASLMREGRIDAVFVGCDRVAANGDAANKIGTSMLALAAKRYGVPFYVCAPTSTIDMSTPTGKDIVIEQRNGGEVSALWYNKPMVPADVSIYNPAFDVTDADLITAIVTEKGVLAAPYDEAIERIRLP